jgi:hypothetical protein
MQWDYGDGPIIDGGKTVLFVAWLAWSRFTIVIALTDKTTEGSRHPVMRTTHSPPHAGASSSKIVGTS